MKDIADPKHRAEEEEYLKQLEQEAREGGDYSFDFIFPKPNFCVELLKNEKASSSKKKNNNMTNKYFVNICESEKVETFTEETTGNRNASQWSVPVSVGKKHIVISSAASRDVPHDFGKDVSVSYTDVPNEYEGALCHVYDAVFHPNTLRLADRSDRFMCFVVEIAVEHINGGYNEAFGFEFKRLPRPSSSGVHSDAKGANCLGTPANQTVRRKDGQNPFSVDKNAGVSKGPQHPTELTSSNCESQKKCTGKEKSPQTKIQSETKAKNTNKVPVHKVLHRGTVDLSDAWNGGSNFTRSTRIDVPKELVVKIVMPEVPTVKALNTIPDNLTDDNAVYGVNVLGNEGAVTVRTVDAYGGYHGTIALPFRVLDDPTEAKFDKSKKELSLTLTVVPPLAAVEEDDEGKQTKAIKNESEQKIVKNDTAPVPATIENTDGQDDAVKPSTNCKILTHTKNTKGESPSRDAVYKEKGILDDAPAVPAVESDSSKVLAGTPESGGGDEDEIVPEMSKSSEKIHAPTHIGDKERLNELRRKLAEARALREGTEQTADEKMEEEPQVTRKEEQTPTRCHDEVKLEDRLNKKPELLVGTPAEVPNNQTPQVPISFEELMEEAQKSVAAEAKQAEDAAEARRRAREERLALEREREEERTDALLKKKMDELPLCSELIFRIC